MGAPSRRLAPWLRVGAVATVAVLLSATSCLRGGSRYADEAMELGSEATRLANQSPTPGTLSQLDTIGTQLDNLGSRQLGTQDAREVARQVEVFDDILERTVWASSRPVVAQAHTTVVDQSATIAQGARRQQVTPRFYEDLRGVTEDAVKGKACEAVRDAAFPPQEEEPPEPGDEEGWQGDLVSAALDVLRKTWNAEDLNRVIDWALWADGVVGTADQVSAAVVGDPDAYVQYAGRPHSLQATVRYAQFCYGPPR